MPSKLDPYRDMILSRELPDDEIAKLAGVQPSYVELYRKKADNATNQDEIVGEAKAVRPASTPRDAVLADAEKTQVDIAEITVLKPFKYSTISPRTRRQVTQIIQASTYRGPMAAHVLRAAAQVGALDCIQR